ncbi:oxidoreductase [Achromobacter sp. RTa]|uniref:MaoC family dehydratase n=1 Tax=Achromobacter sp. RTa TaxID=1532557 RepID=UPI00050E29B0|nr:MaoC family dehydratase [Achromobacter sp. RTa]KGD88281.1 oxidoreductase [Achromobacter sp. RTa]
MITLDSLEALRAFAGQPPALTPWQTVDQDTINRFGLATGDTQWIHMDPERAKAESPYGAAIAHGLLTLSLLPGLFASAMRFPNRRLAVNYGFDRVRFTQAVKAGARIRAAFSLAAMDELPDGQARLNWDVRIDIDGEQRPALVARWLTQVAYHNGNKEQS